MGKKFSIVRVERDADRTFNKLVGTVIIDDNLQGGVVYLNHLPSEFELVPVPMTARPSHTS